MDPADLRSRLAEVDLPDEAVDALSARLDDSTRNSASVSRALGLPWTPGHARPLAVAPVQNALESEHLAPPQGVSAIL
ncbi:MAG: hypothetical protein OXF96_01110, partial [Chloroflexi bacterium]|nr:hypothetical protein [Chloroflexota bacterium]